MRPEKQKELARFSIALDKGEEAVATPSVADQIVKQVMLLNYDKKAPYRAKQLGIHVRTFNRYQTGESAPTLHRAIRLLNLLGYDVIIRKRHE